MIQIVLKSPVVLVSRKALFPRGVDALGTRARYLKRELLHFGSPTARHCADLVGNSFIFPRLGPPRGTGPKGSTRCPDGGSAEMTCVVRHARAIERLGFRAAASH